MMDKIINTDDERIDYYTTSENIDGVRTVGCREEGSEKAITYCSYEGEWIREDIFYGEEYKIMRGKRKEEQRTLLGQLKKEVDQLERRVLGVVFYEKVEELKKKGIFLDKEYLV